MVMEPTGVVIDNEPIDRALAINRRRKLFQNVVTSMPMKIAATGFLLTSLFAATFLVAYQTTQKAKAQEAIDQIPKAEIILPVDLTGVPKENLQEFCGGIANLSCEEGYMCKLDGDYPDASGTCVPN